MLSPAFNTRKDKKLRVCQQVRLVYDDERERERERRGEEPPLWQCRPPASWQTPLLLPTLIDSL